VFNSICEWRMSGDDLLEFQSLLSMPVFMSVRAIKLLGASIVMGLHVYRDRHSIRVFKSFI